MEKRIETDSGAFTIRPFQTGDEGKLVQLWEAAFGQKIDSCVLAWKFWRNPYGIQVMVCVNEENVPVVMFSGIPYSGMYQGRRVQVTHAMDTMSHPGYRGVLGGRRGLYVLTAEHFIRTQTGPGASVFIYGLPGQRHFLLGNKLLGYEKLHNPLSYFKLDLETPSLRVKAWKGRLEFLDGSSLHLTDRLFSKLCEHFAFTVIRDAVFYTWRFRDHPLHDYDLWMYTSIAARRPKGVIAVRKDGHRLFVVDLFMKPEFNEWRDFLARLISHYRGQGYTRLEVWVQEQSFFAELLRSLTPTLNEPYGFVPAYVARTYDPHIPHDTASRHFFYTMADADLL